MSLRWRIAAALGLVAALVCAFGAIAAYVSTSQRLEDSVDESLLARRVGLAPPTDYGPGGSTADRRPPASDGDDPGFDRPSESARPPSAFAPATSAQFVDGRRHAHLVHRRQSDAADGRHRPRDWRESGGDGSRLRTVDVNGESYRILTVARADGGAYELGRSLTEVDDVLSSLKLRLGAHRRHRRGGGGARGLAHRRADREAGRPVAGHGRGHRPHPGSHHSDPDRRCGRDRQPVAQLHHDGRRARDVRREQQRLVGDASHELRTPLTSLRTNAELLGRADELAPGEYEEVVEGVQLEIEELTDLVSELVELAGDSSGSGRRWSPWSSPSWHGTSPARARRRSGREIEVTATGTTTVFVRPQMIERAIGNLVDNAVEVQPGRRVGRRGDRRIEARGA